MTKIDLYYERYMDSYVLLDDYEGHGIGTLFKGDSGYCDNYNYFIYRLKDDLKYNSVDINKITFIRVGYLSTFIPNLEIIFT